MRLFIALPLPINVVDELSSIIHDLKPHDDKVRWAKPSNIHLTLRFLGETDANSIPDLKQILADASERAKPFATTISRVGAFPNMRHPRIIWAGFTDDIVISNVTDLASSIEQSVCNVGFTHEKKKFRPHLTLGRVKDPASLIAIPQVLQNYEIDRIKCRLDRLCLFKSTLTPKGPIYKRLVDLELGAERMSG